MTQCTLNRAVARITGESLGTIRRRGFSLICSTNADDDAVAARSANVVDWDEVDSKRTALFPRRGGK